MATWMRFVLAATPVSGQDGRTRYVRRSLIGQFSKPATAPWWFQAELETWIGLMTKHRALTWDDFPEEEWAEELISRRRPILVSKPTYPSQRVRLAWATEPMMEAISEEMAKMAEAQVNFGAAINPGWLRKKGIIFQEDVRDEQQLVEMEKAGYKAVPVADGTPACLMPWVSPLLDMDFEPAVDPKGDGMLKLMPGEIFSWEPFQVTQEWPTIVEKVWGPQVQTTSQMPSGLKTR